MPRRAGNRGTQERRQKQMEVCKHCGEDIERIFYHGHTWRHVKTSLFICFKDRKPVRGQKNYFEAEPKDGK
jgi:hypothetical protein